MQLSETVKLFPTKEFYALICETQNEYIATVNSLVALAVSGTSIAKYTSANVSANLPSALRCQCVRDANSIVKKHYKTCRKTVLSNRSNAKYSSKKTLVAPQLPILKKPCFYVNNQNIKIRDATIEFPLLVNGKTSRVQVPAKLTERQKELFFNSKLGTLRVVKKGRNLVAQVVYEVAEAKIKTEGNTMGVDLGIKCPAVSFCSDSSVKFFGNGRKNKYMRRHYAHLRKKLQKAKKFKAVKRIDDKEQRIMRDLDHKISHDIVATAVAKNVKVIKLEQLQGIRSTTRISRKNNHSLHKWSFYRLAQFIEYKASLAGISVEYVTPVYTSQRCPVCGNVHHAQDRNYKCSCGFNIHRDVLGAMNICNSTEFVGNRQTA